MNSEDDNDTRTVTDVMMSSWLHPDYNDFRHIRKEARALGVDPDMPYQQFRRVHEIGTRFLQLEADGKEPRIFVKCGPEDTELDW